MPSQLAAAALMLSLSYSFEVLIETNAVYSLFTYMFLIYFFLSTQDIAVDGWAATMLSKENSGHAATCQSIGFVIGVYFSTTAYLVLNSLDFC